MSRHTGKKRSKGMTQDEKWMARYEEDRKIEKGFKEVTRNLTGYDFSRKR